MNLFRLFIGLVYLAVILWMFGAFIQWHWNINEWNWSLGEWGWEWARVLVLIVLSLIGQAERRSLGY